VGYKTVVIVNNCCHDDRHVVEVARKIRVRLGFGFGGFRVAFWPERGSKSMAEITESSAGLDAKGAFFKADGVTPAKIDGDPRWTLSPSAAGDPVATLIVDSNDPYHATIKPLAVPDSVAGSGHTADLAFEGDGDLDAGEDRIVRGVTTVTVIRDEAQTAGITLTPIDA
jgi:hypothetical protein